MESLYIQSIQVMQFLRSDFNDFKSKFLRWIIIILIDSFWIRFGGLDWA